MAGLTLEELRAEIETTRQRRGAEQDRSKQLNDELQEGGFTKVGGPK